MEPYRQPAGDKEEEANMIYQSFVMRLARGREYRGAALSPWHVLTRSGALQEMAFFAIFRYGETVTNLSHRLSQLKNDMLLL